MSKMSQFTRIKCLGKGTFGAAILVKDKAGNKFVVKEIDISKMPRGERIAAEQEAKVLKSLKHPNIVCCTDSFTDGGKLCIVMDFCDGGDLYETLTKQKGVLLQEEVILDWFVQLCLAMKHVHDRKILHRDLKAQNIFMCAGGRMLKVGDFGVAKVLEGTMQLAHTAVGTPYYLSPEICQGKPYNHKSDVWSLGVVLYELATLKHPFDASTLKLLVLKIIKGNYPAVPQKYSSDLRGLIGKMITKDPKQRPSINDILKLPFLRNRIDTFLTEDKLAEEFSHTVLHGQRGLNKVVPAPGGGAGKAPPRRQSGAGGVALPSGGGAKRPSRGMIAPASAIPAPRRADGKPVNDAGARAVQEAKLEAERLAHERKAREAEQRAAAMQAAQRRAEEDQAKADASLVRRADARAAEQARINQQRAETEARIQREAEIRANQEEARIREKKAREDARREEERRMNEARKREFAARQAEAQRNRERYLGKPTQGNQDVEIYMPEGRSEGDRPGGGRMVYASPSKPSSSKGGDALDDEARRRIFWEQKEAAARNRAHAHAQPQDDPEPSYMREENPYPYEQEVRIPKKPTGNDIGAEDRRAAYFEMRAAAERNKAAVMGDVAPLLNIPANEQPASRPAMPARQAAPDVVPYDDDDVLPYDDSLPVVGGYDDDLPVVNDDLPVVGGDDDDLPVVNDDDEEIDEELMPHDLYTISERDSGEFAAMVENMRDFITTVDDPKTADPVEEDEAEKELAELKAEAIAEGDEAAVAKAMAAPLSCLAGKFVLDGNTLRLPNVGNPGEESLPTRVEALREFLEKELGDEAFVESYRMMADVVSNAESDNEEQVVNQIMKVIGEERLGYISLIHQLLVCEDSMMAANKY